MTATAGEKSDEDDDIIQKVVQANKLESNDVDDDDSNDDNCEDAEDQEQVREDENEADS
jgi:hypothetical protein